MLTIAPFANTISDFEKSDFALKLYSCPHCSKTGQLIRHGYLYGYSDGPTQRVIRARRLFCSNRFRRKGCGKTVSTFLSAYIFRSIATAATIALFVDGLFSRPSIKNAWEETRSKLSLNTAYRIKKRIELEIPRLRTLLAKYAKAPPSSHASPLLQTWLHLKSVINKNEPIEAFQQRFQRHFMAR